MGKKTNWAVSEDVALCRAWLCASESALLQGGEHKAGTFWTVVHQLFHAETENSIDRPVNGLKIRWTRLNRDIQRFALTLARVQALTRREPSSAGGAEAAEDEDEAYEQRCIEAAAEQFTKEYKSKFTFEPCWRLLRFSPKWMQLLANASAAGGAALMDVVALDDAATLAKMDSKLDLPPLGAHNTAVAQSAMLAQQKRRLATLIEANAVSTSTSQMQALVAVVATQLKRQSELLEDQNALAVFSLDLAAVEDDDVRTYFEGLRARHAKRIRRSLHAPSVTSLDATEPELGLPAVDDDGAAGSDSEDGAAPIGSAHAVAHDEMAGVV
ncbi:hypothetical protein P43SY_003073 [Pythium insidiosum]|uniref:No apical meristem-associated C-terminal domain-containing protein n=1 Tax=Pythium insidiosum TaxID=114742 RepID=A0AAD5LST0_PYTIN|nr:hypothetical protein P43SY_003073 [Pythium insidiosum]